MRNAVPVVAELARVAIERHVADVAPVLDECPPAEVADFLEERTILRQ